MQGNKLLTDPGEGIIGNNSSGEEAGSDLTISANDWVEWFDQFKDERGEWLHDQSFLEGLRLAFRDDKKLKKTDSADSEEEEMEEEGKSDGPEEERFWPKDSFMGKVQDFTDAARDFLMSKSTTLIARDHPYRSTKPDLLFYKDFHSYLKKHGFIDKMIDVLVKMFGMQPELPVKPLEFIRDNYGISKKDEDKLINEWISVTNEMLELRDEAKLLEQKITLHCLQPSLEDTSTSDGEKADVRSVVSQKIMQRQNEEMLSKMKLTDTQSVTSRETLIPFEWEDDDETYSSSGYSISPQPSTGTSWDADGSFPYEVSGSSSTDASKTVSDFKEDDDSSSSLDFGPNTEA